MSDIYEELKDRACPIADRALYSLPATGIARKSHAYQELKEGLINFLFNKITSVQCAQLFDRLKITSGPPMTFVKSVISVSEQPLKCSTYRNLDFAQRKKVHQWTELEDKRLLAGILRYGFDNWTAIAQFVGNDRSRSQCCQRWQRGLDPKISKDPWTEEDDRVLTEMVKKYGTKSWMKIATEMGNRSDVQCRYRFKQIGNQIESPTSALTDTQPSINNNFYLTIEKKEKNDSIVNEQITSIFGFDMFDTTDFTDFKIKPFEFLSSGTN